MRKWFELLTSKFAAVVYLDEKWFYTTNRCQKIKRLPKGDDEEEDNNSIPQLKVLSCRFLVKEMLMGVVGRSVPENGFDRRIHLERVSITKEVIKLTAHTSFSDNMLGNTDLPINLTQDNKELPELVKEDESEGKDEDIV